MSGERRHVLTLAAIAVVAAMAGAGVTTLAMRSPSSSPALSAGTGTTPGGGTGGAPGGGTGGTPGGGTGGTPGGGTGGTPGGGTGGTPGGGALPGGGAGPFGASPFGGSGEPGAGPYGGSGPFGAFPGGSGLPGVGTGPSTAKPGQHSTAPGSPSGAAAIARRVDPGLVDVNTTMSYQGLRGAGTGMVLTPSGEILTNNHVIEGATSIKVVDVGNGRTYGATVVGYDRTHDVAVLQLTGASGLTTVTTGNSAAVRTGEGVVAIGNANGVGGTPSWAGGKVTGLNQAITASDQASGTSERLHGLIETNAGIISGDSGGSLVNSAGQVVGMDTAASQSYRISSAGHRGFAIPVNEALTIAQQIEAGRSSGTVHIGATAFLGVGVQSARGASGAQITNVVSGGAAAQAGLAAGDTITGLAGQRVSSPSRLVALLLQEHPGNSVRVRYLTTGGRTRTVTVRLASGPPQ